MVRDQPCVDGAEAGRFLAGRFARPTAWGAAGSCTDSKKGVSLKQWRSGDWNPDPARGLVPAETPRRPSRTQSGPRRYVPPGKIGFGHFRRIATSAG